MPRRETAGPGLLRGEGQAAAVLMVGRELGVRERDRAVCCEPGGDLVTRFEFEAVASRRVADVGRAIVAVPSGLVGEVEQPARSREIQLVPEPSAGADFFAHGAGEGRDGRRRKHATHVVRVKAMPVVHEYVELRVLLGQWAQHGRCLGAELMGAADATARRARIVRRKSVVHRERKEIGAAAEVDTQPVERCHFFVHVGAE